MVSESKPKIILDCDPGVDDAIAIITACRWANIVGITSVSGNVPIEHTTSNALKMKKLLNIAAPLHSGASRPIASEPFHALTCMDKRGLATPICLNLMTLLTLMMRLVLFWKKPSKRKEYI